VAVTAGVTFWFIIITTATGNFSFEILAIFAPSVFILTQIFSYKISKCLDIFAVFNTKIFLSILFIFVISIYGILFKFLQIDLLRLKKQKESYWLDIESVKSDMEKQY
jgi:hypothetical protein